MDFDDLVVRDGDLVTASGRLVRDYKGDWLEPPVWVAAAGVGGGPRTIRPAAPGKVRVAGADFDALARRFEDAGIVEGYAKLSGIWSAGQLQVQHQEPPDPREDRLPRWKTPPGPAPAGGWPRGSFRFDVGDLRDTVAVEAAVFRPGPDQEVLVVAATDPDAVEARLRRRLGHRLCVVASRFTAAELGAVRDHLDARHREWKLSRLGLSMGEDGQAYVAASLTRVAPEIASWAAGLPAGILSLDPWLRPTRP
jgi:hypothetical protein